MTNDIRTLALETDTKLAEINTKRWAVSTEIDMLKAQLNSKWYADQTDRIAEEIKVYEAALVVMNQQWRTLNQIWIDNGCWSRTFVVPGGHVHSSMDCHSCYPTTRYYWYVEFSGAEESEIVENAGDRACTICYPSAPVDRPTTMYTPDERQAKVDAEARAQAKIEREAKRIAKAATASGEPLEIPSMYGTRTEIVKTEVAARKEWNRAEDYKGISSDVDRLYLIQEIIENALAEKHGTFPEVMREELQKRYAKRKR